VVHLPIGFLLLALLMQWASSYERFAHLRSAVRFALFWAMLGSLGAALMGYLLSLEGGYEGNTLNWHKWTGIGLTVLTIGLYFASAEKSRWTSYKMPMLLGAVVLLSITGHFGGVLTHGSQYLTEYSPIQFASANATPDDLLVVEKVEDAGIYTHLVQPILDSKCVSCHNINKTKGSLLMDTPEGLSNGGKHGPIFKEGEPFESAMIHRILLPESDRLHMPPVGKNQITTEELSLLQWWINMGANFEVKVREVNLPEPIKAIIQSRIKSEEQLLVERIPALSNSKLGAIRKTGVKIYPMGQESPLLEANMSFGEVNKDQLKALKKASEQLVRLDLSHTNIRDEMLSDLKNFTNLQKLSLHHTAISDKGLQQLTSLQNLRSLNLYSTKVSSASLEVLKQLPKLKTVYLWQTDIPTEDALAFAKSNAEMDVIYGYEQDSTFSSVQLKPPLIVADQDMFMDTLTVDLTLNFGKVDIHYTTDGSMPTEENAKFEEAFQIDSTTLVRAVAIKEGWQASEIAERQFVRVRYEPKDIRLNIPPNPRYAANGPKSLMDKLKGSDQFTDGLWMGWEKQNVEAVIDLGEVSDVSKITVSALENTQSWIFFPRGMEVWTSKTGSNYQKVASSNYPEPKEPTNPSTRVFTESFASTDARFIKLKVKSQLTNPKWHAAPGGSSWVFLDEILVE
jgi:hypothetical protein